MLPADGPRPYDVTRGGLQSVSSPEGHDGNGVYDAFYHLPRQHGKLIPDHLERLFRCLDEVTKRCPHEGCKKRLPLAPMLVHMNDDHLWTREQIADWLTAESV